MQSKCEERRGGEASGCGLMGKREKEQMLRKNRGGSSKERRDGIESPGEGHARSTCLLRREKIINKKGK